MSTIYFLIILIGGQISVIEHNSYAACAESRAYVVEQTRDLAVKPSVACVPKLGSHKKDA